MSAAGLQPTGGSRVWIAGIDGCRGGWFAVLLKRPPVAPFVADLRFVLCPTFSELLNLPENPCPIALDIPIGLLDQPQPGGRPCDRAARALLGRGRASSVFSPPTRTALQARSYPEAMRLNGAGMSKQAFHLMGKIREVDALMQPALQRRIYEAHPELAFLALAGQPMRHNKKTLAGRRERAALVAPRFGDRFIEPQEAQKGYSRSQVAIDDVLDAYALAITASRLYGQGAMRLPEVQAERDSKRLRMEIWY